MFMKCFFWDIREELCSYYFFLNYNSLLRCLFADSCHDYEKKKKSRVISQISPSKYATSANPKDAQDLVQKVIKSVIYIINRKNRDNIICLILFPWKSRKKIFNGNDIKQYY